MSRVYYTGSSPLGGTTPMRTLEAMTGYYDIVGYPVPQPPHGVAASRGNFLITGRSADLLLFGPAYYGCGAQPTIPPGTATLVGNDYSNGTLNNHRITGGTHNRTYSHVGFTGDITGVGSHSTTGMLISSSYPGDIHDITFSYCVFYTSTYTLRPDNPGWADTFHTINTNYGDIYNITFDHCWFEPASRIQVEMNARGGWQHDIVFNHCTFKAGCGEQLSIDISPGNYSSIPPHGVVIDGVVRGVESVTVTHCLFEGSGTNVGIFSPTDYKSVLEFANLYPFASDTSIGRSTFSYNKVGRGGSSWLNFSYGGARYMTFAGNLFDFAYNDHNAPTHNDAPWSGGDDAGYPLSHMTFRDNTWRLGTGSNQPYDFVSAASGTPRTVLMDGDHNTFINESWEKTAGTIGGACEMPFTDSSYTNCYFNLPKSITFPDSAIGTSCTFVNGHTGGVFAGSYFDVTKSPFNIDNTGTTSVTAALDGADGVLATIRNADGVAYFPAGEYLLSTALTVPDGCMLVGPNGTGPDACTAWLQGQVIIGSGSSFTDLKIGPAVAGLAGLRNADGSDGSSFTRCHFRGGGAASDARNSSTVNLGDGRDLSNLTFTDCEFERSLGTAWSGAADTTHRDNTVSIYANSCTVDTVTFDSCHLGVSNGVATGAQRMMVEVWTAHGAGNQWKNIAFTNCMFEASNIHQIDFACYGDSGQGDGVLVEGCTFKGGGLDMKGTLWGYAICLEWPKNVVIRDNTFYRCHEAAIYCANFGQSYDTKWQITGNTFDFDTAYEGITARRGIIVLTGANNTITGNTFTWHGSFSGWASNGCVEFAGTSATGNTVTGNTFNISQTQRIGNNWGGATNNGEPWTSTNTVNRQ